MNETMETSRLAPGFADPVFNSQDTFRRILDAYAYVGRPQLLAQTPGPVGPLAPAVASICLALADFETPIWLDQVADRKSVRDYLGFYCGSPVAAEIEKASFAIVADASDMPRLTEFAAGSDMDPQDSTTVIIQVPSLTGGLPIMCAGPGIPDRISIAIDGLPSWFWDEWAINHDRYPLGVDVIFACDSSVIALPRSVSVEV